jgi:hypothetical protein
MDALHKKMGSQIMWNETIDLLINDLQKNKPVKNVSSKVNESTQIEVVNEAPFYSIKIISAGSYIHLTSFWRAISENSIVFACDDKDQKFGRGNPLNIEEEYNKYFLKYNLVKIEIKKPIHDLVLHFQNSRRIEIFADSCGYESWQIFSKNKQIICTGGGDIAIL